VWLNTLGTQRTSDTGQLGASGAGTVETTGSLADWPDNGFCRITQSGGTLREIVYYSARTDTVLTVPAAGREQLGTSASAGAASDTIDAVPGLKIAKEEPSEEAFTELTDENDTASVSGFTWKTGITESTGLDVGDLTAGNMTGLWLWLVIVAGQTAAPLLENALCFKYSTGTGEDEVIYEPNNAAGQYRVADDDIELYELYRGIDAEPDLDGSPWETFATLPHETAALAVDNTYCFVLRHRNRWGLISQNIESWNIEIDDEGKQVQPRPEAPQNISITTAAGGKGLVTAQYYYDPDDSYIATKWLIYFTDDGSNPDPEVDEPTVVTMYKNNGIATLKWTSPAADNYDILKVIVRTRRTSGEDNYDSINTGIYDCMASTAGPETPDGSAFLGRAAEVK